MVDRQDMVSNCSGSIYCSNLHGRFSTLFISCFSFFCLSLCLLFISLFFLKHCYLFCICFCFFSSNFLFYVISNLSFVHGYILAFSCSISIIFFCYSVFFSFSSLSNCLLSSLCYCSSMVDRHDVMSNSLGCISNSSSMICKCS